ncbi:MAG: hypothetical protein ABI379_02965 [Rhodanobacter sp.]
MTRRVIFALLLAGLALPGLANADAVVDLRGSLSRLQASQPLAASLKVSTTAKNEQGKTTHAQLQVSVASSGNGLTMGFSPDLLQRASREAAINAKNKDAPTPIGDLLGQLSAVSVQSAADHAPVLLREINGAALTSQRDEVHDGKPTHLLVFDVPLPPSASKRMTIKHYTGQIMVWLDSNGVPSAERTVTEVKGRKFLVSIEFGNTSNYRLGTVGSRLVVLSRHSEESHSVFGQSGSSVTDAVLMPEATTAARAGT